ncbi:MAG TPA: hypothetical protein VEL03_00530 [Streptosporangiaceae bacterium]|nr:hypothetical protein [Streptosporangiaceae bacterium]
MTGNDPFGGFGGQHKRPWFGRKPHGYGYGPRTWQGWLVMGLLIILAAAIAGSSGGRGGVLALAVAPVIVVPLIIAWIQRR